MNFRPISCAAGVRLAFGLFLLSVAAASAQPAVTLSHTSFTVVAGGSFPLNAFASGAAPISYQWRKNGNFIANATNATLTLTNVPLGDSGSAFTVAVTNPGGTTVSPPATMTVLAPLTVTVPPVDATVPAGTAATFVVTVTGGAPPISYQWRKNGAVISGATNASYTTPPTVSADNGSVFIVVISSPSGLLIPSSATLIVRPAPVITRQPGNGGVNAGQTLASPFSVDVTGTEPIAFQWFKNGTAIPDATNSSYTPPPGVPADNGSTFKVVVTDAIGSVESTGANLTVRFGAIIATQPTNQSVTPGGNATFTVVASGNPAPNHQWQRLPAGSSTWADLTNSAAYSGVTTAALTIIGTTTAMNGDQFRSVITVVNNGQVIGAPATTNAATLAVKQSQTITFRAVGDVAFSATPIPISASSTSGLPVTFSIVSGPASISGSTVTLTAPGIVTVRATQTGSDSFHAASPIERTFTVSAPVDPARLVNLSIRATAGSDSQTLIVGFTVGGSGAVDGKPLLIRGAGPALAAFGVSDALTDPTLMVFDGAAAIAGNDDWANDIQVSNQSAALGAFAFAPGSRDAALVRTIPPRGYTVQLTGKSAASGVALVEVYDASPSFSGTTARLTNVSARTHVGTGGNILITGFVVAGNGTRRVLVRAVGPALTGFGVSGVLIDPRLELFRSVGAQTVKVSENDDWDNSTLAAQQAAGAFALALGSKDAVLVATLEPGGYTAQISGVNGSTGIALVEIYELP
jgi:hypothetical protein